jgi:hypothetical protein
MLCAAVDIPQILDAMRRLNAAHDKGKNKNAPKKKQMQKQRQKP